MATCAICLVGFRASSDTPIVALQCGHVFDKECLNSWFSHHNRNGRNCPTCRKLSSASGQRTLFMQFESGDVTVGKVEQAKVTRLSEPVSSSASQRIVSGGSADEIVLLQIQLTSAQSALTEARNAQNNLESLNTDLKRQLDEMTAKLSDAKNDKERLRLVNQDLNDRVLNAANENNRLKTANKILHLTGSAFEDKLQSYVSSSDSSEQKIESLVTMLIARDNEMKQEKKKLKEEMRNVARVNQELINMKASNLKLEKEMSNLQEIKRSSSSRGSDDSLIEISSDPEDASPIINARRSKRTSKVRCNSLHDSPSPPIISRRRKVNVVHSEPVQFSTPSAMHRQGIKVPKKTSSGVGRVKSGRKILRSSAIVNK